MAERSGREKTTLLLGPTWHAPHVNKHTVITHTDPGAPSDKVVVGVTSYGRSFKMEQAGCDSKNRQFKGNNRTSNAAPGRCKGVSGYISNAEIKEIIATGRVNRQWKTKGSNFLVYNDTEWVAYMDDYTKWTRSNIYDQYWFAGTTDWAVDLQGFWE
jgi:GH18 family chitinase